MIAIHESKGSFSDYWIPYCIKNNIEYKVVNCYSSSLVQEVEDCDAILWHHHHGSYKDLLFAKQLLFALEEGGKVIFPNYHTNWHFDDKIGQKYLLESVNAPMVKTDVFYSKKDALDWLDRTEVPIVFKLRGGAGASNVKLLKSKRQVKQYINRAFGKGFARYDRTGAVIDRIKKYRDRKASLKNILGGLYRALIPSELDRLSIREKGYFYAQEFIPNNDSDIRVVVIGDRAFCLKRLNRKNDFRASGSGTILYDKHLFSEETIRIAFEVAEKINSTCCAFDFVFKNGVPLIIEISYGFSAAAYLDCQGYWDRDLNYHDEKVLPCDWIIENIINSNQNI